MVDSYGNWMPEKDYSKYPKEPGEANSKIMRRKMYELLDVCEC